MDFLRLRLPGLHQALRGALDSFSAFVSYLIGDTVPTVERQPQAAEELGEVTEGKVVGEETQEVLDGLRSGQSERVGAPEESIRCQEGSLAGEQTWEWRADSSTRPRAERQDTGSRKAAEGARGQEPSVSLKPEAERGTLRDRSSDIAQELWEHGEEEASNGELLRTCKQKEEEEVVKAEVVKATEPGMARGVESQPTWHSKPEESAGTEGQNVTDDRKEIDCVAKDVVAEVEWFGAKGADKEEERMVPTRNGQSARAQGTQCPGAESEDWAMLSREAWTVSGREEADNLGIQEAEYGSDPGDNIPEATGRVWVLEEAGKGDQQDEVDEKREAEARLLIQTWEAERTGEMTEGQIARSGAVGDQETGDSFEDEERQDLATRDNGVSLEEEVQAKESSREKRSHWATEAILVSDTGVKDEPDREDSPGAKTEELFVGEKSEAVQMTPEESRVKVAEGQELELEIIVGTRTVDAEEGPRWEGGLAPDMELGKAWYSEGREEAGRDTELEEATEKQSGQEVGLEDSAEEKVSGYDTQETDGMGEGEQVQMETSVMAEGIRGADGVTLGSQAERAEGSKTTMETEQLLRDQILLKEEAGGGQSREPKGHISEGEIQKLQEEEDARIGAQRTEIQETYPGLDDSSGQEGQQTLQIPTVAMPGPSESAEATAGAPGDVHSNWNEAPLPGSRLDVSVPRSRVLLSRSSSRRRSRPSFRRISVPEPQWDPPSPQPQEELPFPEQSPPRLEETPELSATKPEGTPVPVRRKVLGQGFGFAHPGMMQELQARLSQPKPQ
ncbi:similar to apolipoprotein B48 receptor (predicted), isoform CRA_a [Rattus norvegicus]|uniref:Similar to apolipoprotein B48 receptor (Predicted), isoform CRA_a n=1 Tax=Rattus norvegicus TaxID=10116 RepID=A6I995_RAT|nr:similar to apolipoprotein B48 receptor (predicted), isoform CRA_a [Rattus norvegicus]|eukprot:NP_001102624.1 apolipoprotein B receptor [Rattus norvegicus]